MTERDEPIGDRKAFDRFHVAVLEALYGLEQDGVSPSNEEDLEGRLGYSDGVGFRRDRPLIEDALTDLQSLEWIEIDPRYLIRVTPAGRHVAALVCAAVAYPPTCLRRQITSQRPLS
ncbi:MAG: hypothetical protein ACR2JC_17635 [Chloroflexota bacterium]|nr:MAG: hypothetical protein DLM70_04260 [Chloroflexota bacterium]